jgi:ribosome-binding protein aMBF1 (putative translation factor)
MTKTAEKRPRKARTIPYEKIRAKWLKDPAFIKAHAELEDEFALVEELIRARMKAGLTQAEVAERMQSTQPAVARLESAGRIPSTRTLQRYARATGHRLRIKLVPALGRTSAGEAPSSELPRGSRRRSPQPA